MKYLIVNGDDFGASRGINRGIADAHRNGILTSASLMVDMPRASEAADISRQLPGLGVGLHAVFTREDATPLMDFADTSRCRDELMRQLQKFELIMGRSPTHLDSHHNIHRDRRLQQVFVAESRERNLPLREHSAARYFSNFYGQWDDGETHLEQVSVEMLSRMLETELRTEVTEFGCHPGYCDDEFSSSYSREREAELETLCDPRIRQKVSATGARLIHFGDLRKIMSTLQARPPAAAI